MAVDVCSFFVQVIPSHYNGRDYNYNVQLQRANPDKPHLFKRISMSRPKESFHLSPQSLPKSSIPAPKSKVTSTSSGGKIRTGRKRPSWLVNIGNTYYANSLLQAFRCIPEFVSLYELHPTLSTDFSESVKYLTSDKVNFRNLYPSCFLEISESDSRSYSKPQVAFKSTTVSF